MGKAITPYWKLTTGENGCGRPPGAMRKIASYLYTNKEIGDLFTADELRKEIVDGAISKNENLTRRLRELREIGWSFESYKDNPSQNTNTYKLLIKGWHPLSKSAPLKNNNVDDKTRRLVFERDNLRCCVCGIGAGESYPSEPTRFARLTIGHKIPKSKGGSNNIINLPTECSRCNEPFRDTPIDDISQLLEITTDKENKC